jgi:hypothetical protein
MLSGINALDPIELIQNNFPISQKPKTWHNHWRADYFAHWDIH